MRTMTAQLINRQGLIFRLNGNKYQFVKPNYLYRNDNERIEAKIKGSTMGWYIEDTFFTYNKLKELFK